MALITCRCLSSFYIRFNPDLMVSFAAIYKGISIEMHTANQCKALCLDILKNTQKNLVSKLKLRHKRQGGFCLHILICPPAVPFCSDMCIADSFFDLHLYSFPDFPGNIHLKLLMCMMGTSGCMLQLPLSK